MPLLPVGFFMPLPLPIMIPFMMWQSAAIAAGFGTYFQFAKRRVSAMSNEEFNKADPHELVNSMYEDIVKSIPSSFDKMDSLTPVILQSMNVMLDQAIKWLGNVITGNLTGTGGGGGADEPPLLEETTTELLTLTIQFISTMNDLSLEATIRNITDYNQITRDLLLAEQARRKRTGEPSIEPPTKEQETTKITPTFAASLSRADLEKGGHRHRTTRDGVIHWNGTHRIDWDRTTIRTAKWTGSFFTPVTSAATRSEATAVQIVNKLKREIGSAYVLEFKTTNLKFTWYLISDIT